MNAEIVSVGTELLLGDIVNTNAQFVSQQLASLGLNVYFQTTVGDNPKRLAETIENALNRADLVITTGGLGPTADDLTKETVAEFFGLEMLENKEETAKLIEYFKKRGYNMTSNNLKQAFFPDGSKIMPNSRGTAAGCILEKNGKIVAMFPGPPVELKPMFTDHLVPFLKSKQDSVLVSKVIRLFGIGESDAETKVKDLLETQTNPTIAPYVQDYELRFRITAKVTNEADADKLINPVKQELYKRFGDLIYGEDDKMLAETVVDLLKAKNYTIACAESCTGGLLTSRLVDVSGVSDVLLEGAVTYSNSAKVKRLGVKNISLENFGAVSEQVAAEMAEGIALSSGTNVGVSTTGIAGPSGGTDEKPVGLVFIGVSVNGKTKVFKRNMSGSRDQIRNRTAVTALDLVRRCVCGLE